MNISVLMNAVFLYYFMFVCVTACGNLCGRSLLMLRTNICARKRRLINLIDTEFKPLFNTPNIR